MTESAPGRPRREVESLADRARRAIPGGINSANRRAPELEDLVVVRTEGAHFWDAAGSEYLDMFCAGGPVILGHSFDAVDQVARDRTRHLDQPGVGRTDLEVELAELIGTHVPSADRVLLTMSGSEATYHALRLARAATGRSKVVKFEGCYHGWHDSVALGFSLDAASGRTRPMSEGSMSAVLDATVVLDFNDSAGVRAALADRDVAAVIVEPIAHNVGCLMPADGFLQSLREACTETGTVLVFDEVVTGFRHGLGGYQAISDVVPDLTALGKAIANGYPIAALAGRAELMDAFSTCVSGSVLFAGTYNGHPVSTAAAIATIEVLAQAPVYDHIFMLGEQLRVGLDEVFARHDTPVDVAGFGSVYVTYFRSDGTRAETFSDLASVDAAGLVDYRRELVRRGIFEFPVNLKRCHVSFAHTSADVTRVLDVADTVLRQRTTRTKEP
jgi:glutamate-1-semialdehyde 2,1-aminomutase